MFWILMVLFQAKPSRHAKYETCQKPSSSLGAIYTSLLPGSYRLLCAVNCRLIWLYDGSNTKVLWMVKSLNQGHFIL